MTLNDFCVLIARTHSQPLPNATVSWENLQQPVVAFFVELADGTVIKSTVKE